jgi:hypothetical protein
LAFSSRRLIVAAQGVQGYGVQEVKEMGKKATGSLRTAKIKRIPALTAGIPPFHLPNHTDIR